MLCRNHAWDDEVEVGCYIPGELSEDTANKGTQEGESKHHVSAGRAEMRDERTFRG
jgi:hypothetical protein